MNTRTKVPSCSQGTKLKSANPLPSIKGTLDPAKVLLRRSPSRASGGSRAARRDPSLIERIRLPLVAGYLGLSPREVEVLTGFFSQETEAAAAHRLGLSQHTVHTYVQRIYRKLNSTDRCSTVIRIFAMYLALAINVDVSGLS
jgi:DNA-binding NarL/FixJ family response regulator